MAVRSTVATDEDTLIGVALDAGADDVKAEEESFEIYAGPGSLARVVEALEAAGIPVLNSEVTRIPTTTVRVEGKDAQQVLKMMDQLEEHDDVQRVHANFDIPDEVLESAVR